MAEEQRGHAPYVSLEWLRNYVRRIQQSASAILDKELAAEMGATGTNWTQLPKAVRELGIINGEGRVTEDIGEELAAGAKRSEAAAKMVLERTYPSLVARLKNGEELSGEALLSHFYDVFRRERGKPLGASARRQATAVFRFWVEQGGDEQWMKLVRAPKRTRQKDVAKPPRPRRKRNDARKAGQGGQADLLAEMLDSGGFEEVFAAMTPLYRVSIQARKGTQLTAADWDQVKQSISAQIDYLKSRLPQK